MAQITAIKAGSLIDPDAGAVLNDQVILVRDNRVAAVGKGLSIPAGAKVIDLSKMTVLPGLSTTAKQIALGKCAKLFANLLMMESITSKFFPVARCSRTAAIPIRRNLRPRNSLPRWMRRAILD